MTMFSSRRNIASLQSVLSTVALGTYLLILTLLFFAKIPAVSAGRSVGGTDFRIVTFNTEYWHIPEQELVALVHYQDMDLVFFQEHLEKIGESWGPTNRIPQLKAVLKDRYIGWSGEVVTISKWPIVQSRAFLDGLAVRIDVLGPGGRVISAYNIHLPVHLHLGLLPNPLRFYEDAQAAAARRQQLLDEVLADLSDNSNPIIVAGDFNSSAAMNGIAWFRSHMTDAYAADHCSETRDTFEMNSLMTWRIDYVFVSSHFKPYSYCTQVAPHISDHSAIIAGISLHDTQPPANHAAKGTP